jgi:hypothetical protein
MLRMASRLALFLIAFPCTGLGDEPKVRRSFRLEASKVLLGEPVLVEYRIEVDGPCTAHLAWERGTGMGRVQPEPVPLSQADGERNSPASGLASSFLGGDVLTRHGPARPWPAHAHAGHRQPEAAIGDATERTQWGFGTSGQFFKVAIPRNHPVCGETERSQWMSGRYWQDPTTNDQLERVVTERSQWRFAGNAWISAIWEDGHSTGWVETQLRRFAGARPSPPTGKTRGSAGSRRDGTKPMGVWVK